MSARVKLYHYTCRDRYAMIRGSGLLRANQPHLRKIPPAVWLTDLETPDRLGLGLTSFMLRCDRTEHRVIVELPGEPPLWHWPRWAHKHLALGDRDALELNPGVLPMHWWLYLADIPLELGRLADAASPELPLSESR